MGEEKIMATRVQQTKKILIFYIYKFCVHVQMINKFCKHRFYDLSLIGDYGNDDGSLAFWHKVTTRPLLLRLKSLRTS